MHDWRLGAFACNFPDKSWNEISRNRLPDFFYDLQRLGVGNLKMCDSCRMVQLVQVVGENALAKKLKGKFRRDCLFDF